MRVQAVYKQYKPYVTEDIEPAPLITRLHGESPEHTMKRLLRVLLNKAMDHAVAKVVPVLSFNLVPEMLELEPYGPASHHYVVDIVSAPVHTAPVIEMYPRYLRYTPSIRHPMPFEAFTHVLVLPLVGGQTVTFIAKDAEVLVLSLRLDEVPATPPSIRFCKCSTQRELADVTVIIAPGATLETSATMSGDCSADLKDLFEQVVDRILLPVPYPTGYFPTITIVDAGMFPLTWLGDAASVYPSSAVYIHDLLISIRHKRETRRKS
jgi:hypothetical protein